ncbi:IclR family transcriptional regulator [Halostella litorea]|uniref:IclR family transcriptional regulator n=1 Tax=Halostella litorea TaxID=2528831 RepID=UPI0010931B39|nr:IclR family transcriptional regulator [Halostella litorea]
MTDETRTFSTTETSFAVVHVIEDAGGATFAELRSRLDLSKSSLYYHLATLEKLGYVVKEDGTYQLGLRFLSHAERARRKEPAFDVVRSKARDLADEIPEEITFSTEENGRLVVVYHNIGGSAMTDFKIGQYLHMHATANGKVLLAEMSDERIDEIIDRWGLPALTEQTITDRDELRAELDRIAEQGYAVNDEEQREGLRSVGAKITKPDGSVLGGLAVDGPTYRLTDEQIEQSTVGRLFDTIDEIEAELG